MASSWNKSAQTPDFWTCDKNGVLNGATCYSQCVLEGKYMLVVVMAGSIHLMQHILDNAPDFSGISQETVIAGSFSENGNKDGHGNKATFGSIQVITVIDNKYALMCDIENKSLRSMKLTPLYNVETVCGNGIASHKNLEQVRFKCPIDVCVDKQNNIFVLDRHLKNIYKIISARDGVCFLQQLDAPRMLLWRCISQTTLFPGCTWKDANIAKYRPGHAQL